MSALATLPTVRDMVEIVPRGWNEIAGLLLPHVPGARGWTIGQLRVIVSVDDCGIEGLWLHTSVSRRANGRIFIPTWDELSRVKQVVHGDRLVVQILPPRREYVNITEALHLWERLDQPTLPSSLEERSR